MEFLRIPSISADPACRGDIQRAAEWVNGQFQSLGLASEIIATPGNPLVYAQSAAVHGRAGGAGLRALRRPARGAARSVDLAAVRAGMPGREHLRPRGHRRQGADCSPT